MELPKRYDPKESEPKWQEKWKEWDMFRFDKESRKPIYSIDTPPPTVSGTIHMGHIFSYSHADFIARFWRMRGCNVFYPFGFDDNGLPTERYVENARWIKAAGMARKDFQRICLEETGKAEKQFEALWKREQRPACHYR